MGHDELTTRALTGAGGHTRWDDFKREIQPELDEWRRQHPWRCRWQTLHFKARPIIWKLTRIDIG